MAGAAAGPHGPWSKAGAAHGRGRPPGYLVGPQWDSSYRPGAALLEP